MIDNIYLYYYENYFQVLKCIKECKIEDVFLGYDYDRYTICTDEGNNIVILVYKNIKIISISCNRYKDIKDLNILDNLNKVNLLNKMLFNKLFEMNFSSNLCRIIIDIDILGDDEEILEFSGHKLLDRELIENFQVDDTSSLTKLKLYSLQPYGYKYLISFRATNKLEFSKKFDNKEIEEILMKLVIIIGYVLGENKSKDEGKL